jgi:hypothetical protein
MKNSDLARSRLSFIRVSVLTKTGKPTLKRGNSKIEHLLKFLFNHFLEKAPKKFDFERFVLNISNKSYRYT